MLGYFWIEFYCIDLYYFYPYINITLFWLLYLCGKLLNWNCDSPNILLNIFWGTHHPMQFHINIRILIHFLYQIWVPILSRLILRNIYWYKLSTLWYHFFLILKSYNFLLGGKFPEFFLKRCKLSTKNYYKANWKKHMNNKRS